MITVPAFTKRLAAEFVGSAALAAIVVGSGIAAVNLSSDAGLQLLINALVTAFGLFVLITVLGALSGAHLNPLVSTVDIALGLRRPRELVPYVAVQVVGCIVGCVLANLMFDLPPISWSATGRGSAGQLLSEVVATAGLVFVIFALARTSRAQHTAAAVAAYIGAAYFFTSSTSFANPAITIGRMFTDSFAGIAPASVMPYLGAQIVGAGIGYLAVRLLTPPRLTAVATPAHEAVTGMRPI